MIQNDREHVSLIPAPTDSTTDRDPRQRNNPDNAKMQRNVSGNATCQARLPTFSLFTQHLHLSTLYIYTNISLLGTAFQR